MQSHPDLSCIAAVLPILDGISSDARALQFENLCVNNGCWGGPERGDISPPFLFEAKLFGVPAVGGDGDELARNWIRAARRMLEEIDAEAVICEARFVA